MQGRPATIRVMTRAALRALRDAGVPHMVIGAVAAGVWGTPRFTADADFVAAVPPDGLDNVLDAFARRGFHANPSGLRESWRSNGSIRLPFRRDPVLFHIDLLAADSDYDREALDRARPRVLFGMPVRVAAAEDVILYKLVARRPQDRIDVGGIVGRQRRRLDVRYLRRWARWLARTYPAFAAAERDLRTALKPIAARQPM